MSDSRVLARALVDGLAETCDRPVALFGHSLGALLAFEVARAWRAASKAPLHLFVSGRQAPHLEDRDARLHALSNESFLREIVALNGTPPEVLADGALMRILVPVLRADFGIIATYRYRSNHPLDCPITALGGDADDRVGLEDLAA